MDRAHAIQAVAEKLGNRRLIWFGSAGQDGRSLTSIPQFSHAFSLMARLDAPGIQSFSVEELMGARQDDYDPAAFFAGNGLSMLGAMGAALSTPAALIAEGQNELFAYIGQIGAHVDYLGVPMTLYDALRDKHAVEAALHGRPGIVTIPWKMLSDGDSRFDEVKEELRRGPVVVRGGKHGGGIGHELIREAAQVRPSRVLNLDAPVAVAPYLTGYVPVCVGACVFPDGGITLHASSLQLIGLQICRRLDFGYCGNDFAAFKELGPSTLERLESCVRAAGLWLHSRGFVGAFGVDALVREDEAVFVEINPRFQGSSRMSAELDAEMDLPGIHLAHLLAWLGAPSYRSPSLVELAAGQASRAQIICDNNRDEPVSVGEGETVLPPGYSVELAPPPRVSVAPGSALCAVIANRDVTRDGMSLHPPAIAAVETALARFRP
jgi:hypothetical protein